MFLTAADSFSAAGEAFSSLCHLFVVFLFSPPPMFTCIETFFISFLLVFVMSLPSTLISRTDFNVFALINTLMTMSYKNRSFYILKNAFIIG